MGQVTGKDKSRLLLLWNTVHLYQVVMCWMNFWGLAEPGSTREKWMVKQSW